MFGNLRANRKVGLPLKNALLKKSVARRNGMPPLMAVRLGTSTVHPPIECFCSGACNVFDAVSTVAVPVGSTSSTGFLLVFYIAA